MFELRRIKRGLVDYHGHALDLHALHDAPDGARVEVGRSLKWCMLTCTLGLLIAANLSAGPSATNNAYSPNLAS